MKKFVLLALGIMLFSLGNEAPGQQPYKLPPQDVMNILEAPPFPRVIMSPRSDLMLLAEMESMPSISRLAQPFLSLAGLRITPQTNSRQQLTFITSLSLKVLKDGTTRKIPLPDGATWGSPEWSFDGQWIAFLRFKESAVELWAANTVTAEAKAVSSVRINTVLNPGFIWLPDSRHLLIFTVLETRGKPPEIPSVPGGPKIQETSGKFTKAWTYQDLLQNPYDEMLFDYYSTSQILEIDVTTGQSRRLGSPGIYFYADSSPDGKFLLVYRIKKPYSYTVPFSRFSHTMEIWDSNGEMVRLLADLPTAEEVPPHGVPKGLRSAAWQPLKSSTLMWAEALDEGDPEKEAPYRDRLFLLSSPFSSEPKECLRIQHRYESVEWLASPGYALVTESDWKRRWRTTYLLNMDRPEIAPQKLFDLSERDDYNDPGRLVTTTTLAGEKIAFQERGWIHLSGNGASGQGDRPFLDKINVETSEKKRLFWSAENQYEIFIDFAGNSRDRIIIRSESPLDPPNYYIFDLKTKKRTALTEFPDPAPQLKGIKKELIKYRREDGVELSGTLYLPPDYREGKRLPAVVWAYPLEYSDAGTAGQVRGSPNRFSFFRGASQLFFVTQGYAVLDGAQMPVVGDPKTMNDTFVGQIIGNAKAAIDVLEAKGIADRTRVGVGGHSYGAFMTANLLAHSDLFAAGIARSGAYNRTLTPFGFQSERRTLWEAPDIYIKMSPFLHAHKINEPILLIHGEADNNSGTFPIQSERLFHALKGFGATARLVMLPCESHGYAAKESIFHVLAEMFEWFDKYIKNKK